MQLPIVLAKVHLALVYVLWLYLLCLRRVDEEDGELCPTLEGIASVHRQEDLRRGRSDLEEGPGREQRRQQQPVEDVLVGVSIGSELGYGSGFE